MTNGGMSGGDRWRGGDEEEVKAHEAGRRDGRKTVLNGEGQYRPRP
jgi:hypothetical protein